jgi:signal transduction histidine kinase
VINLVGNAIKFTEQGLVKLSLQKHDQVMVLQVSDTGMGIPPHAREYIFEEFRQVDQSSKRQHGGTGLGLAIVQRLVRAMNGTVTLESEVGVGSTFTVQIPIATEQLALEGVM